MALHMPLVLKTQSMPASPLDHEYFLPFHFLRATAVPWQRLIPDLKMGVGLRESEQVFLRKETKN